jgi:hypothetical protein
LLHAPELAYPFCTECIANQVKATRSLDRQQGIAGKELTAPAQDPIHIAFPSACMFQQIGGPTVVAGHRLGMEPPVMQIIVFGPAYRAHPEGSHGCMEAVVGKIAYDGEPGATVCAVDQWIIHAVNLRFQIIQAVLAYGYIRTDLCNGFTQIAAGPDQKRIERFLPDLPYLHGFYTCRLGSQAANIFPKRFDLSPGSIYLHHHPVIPVLHPSKQTPLPCHPVNKGTESDTLDQAFDPDAVCSGLFHVKLKFKKKYQYFDGFAYLAYI